MRAEVRCVQVLEVKWGIMFKALFRKKTSPEISFKTKIPVKGQELVPAGSFRFVAVDVETANRDTGSICQIGCAFVSDTGRISVNTYLVDPETHFDNSNISIHGITPDDVVGQPNFEQVFGTLQAVLKKNKLVQHSSFDSRAIRLACETYGLAMPALDWHDSVRIARQAWPELKGAGGHGLAHLRTFLGLEFQHHNAGEDARAAAEIVLHAEAHTGRSFLDLAAPASRSGNWQPSVKMEGDAMGALFGQIAVFTGTLSMSRTEAATIAAAAGIETKAGMSRKVTLLVVGDQDLGALAAGQTKSSKHRKAEELIAQGYDIRILGETEFLTLVRS